MAQQEGPFEFSGRLGPFVGYTLNGKKVVRTIGKPRQSNPKSQAVRAELSVINASNKAFRMLLHPFIADLDRKQLDNDITKIFSAIRKLDPFPYGEGDFRRALLLPEASSFFHGFEFNLKPAWVRYLLQSQLFADRASRVLKLSQFSGLHSLRYPSHSGFARLSSCVVRWDADGSGTLSVSEQEVVHEDDASFRQLELTPLEEIHGPGLYFVLLKIVFFERVNGIDYPTAGSRGGCMVVDCWRE